MRLRAKVTEGAELRVRFHHGVREHAVRLERDAIAHGASTHVAACAYHALRADGRGAFEDGPWIDHGVRADLHRVVHVGGGGVDHGHAFGHEPVERPPSQRGRDVGELPAVIDAETFLGVGRGERLGDRAVLGEEGDHVGEVVLPLLVLGRDAIQCAPQPARVEAIDAGADLVNRPLGRGGVGVLDDGDGAAALPDHAPVSRGVAEHRGEEGGRRARRVVSLDEGAEHRFRHEGLIAGQHENRPRPVAAGAARLQEGMAGAQPLFLLGIRQIACFAHGRANGVGLAADHEHHPRAEGPGHPYRIVDEPAATQEVQGLGAA